MKARADFVNLELLARPQPTRENVGSQNGIGVLGQVPERRRQAQWIHSERDSKRHCIKTMRKKISNAYLSLIFSIIDFHEDNILFGLDGDAHIASRSDLVSRSVRARLCRPARGHPAARREGTDSGARRGDPGRAAPISRVPRARQTVSGGGMEWKPPVARGAIAKPPATAPCQGTGLRHPEDRSRAVSADCRADSCRKNAGAAAESPGEGTASGREGALTIPGP